MLFYMNVLAQKDRDALKSPRVVAFLDTIAKSEGTDKTGNGTGYNVLFGGERIKDLSRHPARVVARTLGGKPLRSSACGRYQFLTKTWKALALKLDLPDFGPESQDIAAVELLRECKALPLVLQGQFADAVHAARKIWASFPGAGYGQPENTLNSLQRFYEKRLAWHEDDRPKASRVATEDSPTAIPPDLPTESPELVTKPADAGNGVSGSSPVADSPTAKEVKDGKPTIGDRLKTSTTFVQSLGIQVGAVGTVVWTFVSANKEVMLYILGGAAATSILVYLIYTLKEIAIAKHSQGAK